MWLILSYLCFCIATLPFHSTHFAKVSDFGKAENSQYSLSYLHYILNLNLSFVRS
ncbi:hypothetical protein HMPREF1321_0515 [Capnocytophaga sp. oral taxon 412 str. F0487]|nr:hypothetical protein HMPREF1321_0515 [Capnocytophaga sp. oral taxon 412 str. F0487]